jgi:hypothetical protein
LLNTCGGTTDFSDQECDALTSFRYNASGDTSRKINNLEPPSPEKGLECARVNDLLVSLMKQSDDNESQAI